jgi:hypothetical protein
VEDLSDPKAGATDRSHCSHEGAFRVILWLQRQSDWQKISTIAKRAGARPVFVEELSGLRPVQCSAECCVAVVVTGPIPRGVGTQVIRDLKMVHQKSIRRLSGTDREERGDLLPEFRRGVEALERGSHSGVGWARRRASSMPPAQAPGSVQVAGNLAFKRVRALKTPRQVASPTSEARGGGPSPATALRRHKECTDAYLAGSARGNTEVSPAH